MLKIDSLTKRYDQHTVLNQLSLSVQEQAIYGFIGCNGAGKTTLIKCLLNFLEREQGTFSLEQTPMEDNPSIYKKIGYLPEVFVPPLDLKGYELIDYAYEMIAGTRAPQDIKDKALNQVGLKGKESLFIRNYSKGMRQRLGIAQAMIHDPLLLILDEPFSGLDPKGRYELKQLILNLSQSNKTIFFSSHNLNEIQDLCTHVGILHNGKICHEGTINNVLSELNVNHLEEAFYKVINDGESAS